MESSQSLPHPVQAIYDNVNSGNIQGILENVSDDFELLDVPFNRVIRGKNAFAEYLQAWKTAFPDGQAKLENIIISPNDEVVVEVVATGTNYGLFSVSPNPPSPSGQKVEIHFCQIYQIQNGKIAQGRSYYDSRTLFGSMGVQGRKSA